MVVVLEGELEDPVADLDAAVDHALLLEWLAVLHHRATTLGTPRPLSDEQQAAVIEAAVGRGYGTPQENA